MIGDCEGVGLKLLVLFVSYIWGKVQGDRALPNASVWLYWFIPHKSAITLPHCV